MKTSYYIGEMAKYFGVSTDTLRIYDKKGILSPRKEANGYRVYSREDMIFFEYVFRLRQLGLSLDEVKQLTGNCSIEEVEQVFEEQSRRLLKRLDELRALYSVTQDYSGMLRKTNEGLGHIHITTSPRMILHPIDESLIRAVAASRQLCGGSVPWFCTVTDPKDILADDTRFNIYDYRVRNNALKNAVVILDPDNTVQIPADLRGEFTVLEPRKCIHMAARGTSRTDYEAFVRLRQFTLDNGYTATGDMISIFVAVRCGAQGEADYYQVYLPVE